MFFSTKFIITLKVVLCIIFLGIVPNLYAQTTYKVVYNVEPILQKPLDNTSQNTKDIIKRIVDYAESINYILVANQEESSFEEEEFLIKGAKSPLEDIYIKGARMITSFNEKTYTNYKIDSIVFVKNLLDEDFAVKRKVYEFNWKIKDTTKNVLGFQAKKAEGAYYNHVTDEELNVEVWFIPAIPLQAGPDIFTGLPGLIVEVHLGKAVIKARRIEQKQHLRIERPYEEQIMNQKEYEDLLSKLKGKFL